MSQTKQPGLAARVGAQDGFPPRPTARAKGEPPRREKQCQPCLPPSTAALHRPRCPLIPRARCLSREAEKAPQGEWSRATGGDRETAAGGGTGRCPGGGDDAHGLPRRHRRPARPAASGPPGLSEGSRQERQRGGKTKECPAPPLPGLTLVLGHQPLERRPRHGAAPPLPPPLPGRAAREDA